MVLVRCLFMWFILIRLIGIMPERGCIENVFDKPDEQRPSFLGLCHGEKTKAKSTFSISQMSNDERGMSIAELWISYHSSHHIINKD